MNLNPNTIDHGFGEKVGAVTRGGTKVPVVETNLPLTIFGDLRTAELSPIFQGSFEYTVDNTELNTNIVVAGGTVTQGSAMAVVGTSTTTGSTACFQSKRHARYRAGLGGVLRLTTLFTAPVAATEQYSGLMDEEGSGAAFKNGLAVGYDGLTFGFHRFTNDVKISAKKSAWDDPLDGSGKSKLVVTDTELANVNIWFIRFGYLGIANPELWFMPPIGPMILVHTIRTAGALTTPHSFNPNYHFMMWANNKATTADIVVKAGSYAYFTEGKTELIESHQPQQSTGEQSKAGVTTEVAICTIKNKAVYQSKTNFIDVFIELNSSSIEASSSNNLGDLRLVRNATLGGTPVYVDINTSDSIVAMDISGTSVAGGKEITGFPLAGKNDKEITNLIPYKIILAPGETLTVAGSSANTATIKARLLWKELF